MATVREKQDTDLEVVDQVVNRLFRCKDCKTMFISINGYEDHYRKKHAIHRPETVPSITPGGSQPEIAKNEDNPNKAKEGASHNDEESISNPAKSSEEDLICIETPRSLKLEDLEEFPPLQTSLNDSGLTSPNNKKPKLDFLNQSMTDSGVDSPTEELPAFVPEHGDQLSTVENRWVREATSTYTYAYECSVCPFSFVSEDLLILHFKEKHLDQIAAVAVSAVEDQANDPDKGRRRSSRIKRKKSQSSCLCDGLCNDESMIRCDNKLCDVWYHFGCVQLEKAPPSRAKWYCPRCMQR